MCNPALFPHIPSLGRSDIILPKKGGVGEEGLLA